MHDAPRYEPLEASTFFTDGRASRTLVANTVARGQLREDEHLYTGKVDGQLATTFPMPVTAEVMARGQERFNVFCSPCHGRTGEGNGMIVQRGFRAAAVVPRGAAAQRAGRLLLRRHDQRLWRDAGLRGAGAGGRPLGDRRLHPRAAAQSARDGERRAGGPPRRSSIARRRAPAAAEPQDARAWRLSLHPRRRRSRRAPRTRARSPASSAWPSARSAFVVDRDHFFRVVADRLPAVPRHRARLDGADDDPAPVGRHVGRVPPRLRGVEPDAAAAGAAVRPGRARDGHRSIRGRTRITCRPTRSCGTRRRT